jgi:hypothetical protein
MSISPQEFLDLLDPAKNGFTDAVERQNKITNASLEYSNKAIADALTAQKIKEGLIAYEEFNMGTLKDTIGFFTPIVSDVAGTAGQAVGTIGKSVLGGLAGSLGMSENMLIGLCCVGVYIVFIK